VEILDKDKQGLGGTGRSWARNMERGGGGLILFTEKRRERGVVPVSIYFMIITDLGGKEGGGRMSGEVRNGLAGFQNETVPCWDREESGATNGKRGWITGGEMGRP